MKQSEKAGFLDKLSLFFASNAFFYGTLAVLTLMSTWVAISSLYPMAFDEEFHLGLIKIYAELWNPFSVVQAPEAAVFGSITTDPSYLFHYLMSFPYRLLAAVTTSETAIVITLRMMNVVMFVLSLVLYRKVLLRAKLSPALVHVVMALFILIPVVPLLAGQINYDNLLMLIVAGVFWLVLMIREQLRAKRQLPAKQAYWLIILLLIASVVKYAFLPIAAGAVIYVIYEIFYASRANKKMFTQFIRDTQKLSRLLKAGLVFCGIISVVLFSQRYVVNLVRYHDPVPDCAAVISIEECSQYGPWGRDYRYSQKNTGQDLRSPVGYTATHWAWGMWHRLFFTLAGPTNGYATRNQLPIPATTTIIISAVGVVLLLVYSRTLFRQYPIFVLFTLVSLCYVAALWLQVYQLYVYTGRPVAINGRYLIPLLPALGVMCAAAYVRFFNQTGLRRYKGLFATLIIVLFLQGGGFITYIVKSEPRWYWPNSFTQDTNQKLQNVLKPVIIGD